ncbi:hypothetical protein IVA80_02505 [Bradyrhizobium sp. 139]|uniref:hypothetical protein n=1 Tax=Bradyrhizobium sp. 139 TaxID=2782616 RepID=UPI001FFB5BA4|nr:hypothetical protein [Bradyrhizobium sp. 139]MCK1739775.1 hypothetical protein [Bradyrhizobium sp. 139]
MLEIINNLPRRLICHDLGLQDDPLSQMLWLIVASAAGRLVYDIPEGKRNLVTQRKKSARFRPGAAIAQEGLQKRKRPAVRPGVVA